MRTIRSLLRYPFRCVEWKATSVTAAEQSSCSVKFGCRSFTKHTLEQFVFLFGLDASLSFLSTSRRWWINEFPRHLRDVERNNNETSKPVAGHLNLPNNSKQHMAVCSLSLHLGSSESCKTLEKNLSSKSALLIPTVSTSAFHSTY